MTNTTFIQFRDALQKRFDKLAATGNLFQSGIEKDVLWDLYLSSFPEGTNKLFRERTEHDCVCCKQFIRNIGRVLGSNTKGELVSIFDDLQVTGEYKVVAEKLAEANKKAKIFGIYLNEEQEVGKRESYEQREDGTVHTWNHFHQVLPAKAFSLLGDIAERKGKVQTNCKVLKRSITTLSVDAVDTVLELIDQNAIHRGNEFIGIVKGLKTLQGQYENSVNKELFLWNSTLDMQAKGFECNMRGTVIGTLLQDLTADVPLEDAVKKYEDKVSGTNYKRTTALVTPRMKEMAKATAKELGIEPSFPRRFANKCDISVNDVLFADNSVKAFMEDSVFDMVDTHTTTTTAKGKDKHLDNVQEVSVKEFIENILPSAKSVEVFVENKHESNLVNLIAPINASAPCIMKWGNNFSWNYNGEVAESVIKQQVKAAGGVVDAPLRVSLSWNNRNDLDLHLTEPNGNKVYFGRKLGNTGSKLDVDMRGERVAQVENIYWENLSKLANGTYFAAVHNYSKNPRRNGEAHKEGFEIEVEHNGDVYNIPYANTVKDGQLVSVLSLIVKDGVITVRPVFNSGSSSTKVKTVWGIDTGKFHKVNMVMKSPNYWDNSKHTGNEHVFFMLDQCTNPDEARGFYNEFLIEELKDHRKVFEVLAANMKAEYSDDQLSGLGFSTTLRSEVVLKVTGSFTRTIKVKF